jgi:3'-phosphoadenosine 5'-phosphosulfate sulfotransferase (PAPS reductase)/FAD synthetase
VEPYPVVSGGSIVGFVASSPDITVVYDATGKPVRTVVWYSRLEGAVVDKVASSGVLRAPNGDYIDVRQWFEDLPRLGFYTFRALDEHLEWLENVLRGRVEGRRVAVMYSGGKDSYVALVVLSRLSERLRFRLYTLYSHMPVLEPEENVDIARKHAERIGVEFIDVSPPERIVLRYLYTEGLPYRGARWCTYLKTRPLREEAKRLQVDFMVRGDRLVEAGKRLRRLYRAAVEGKIVEGKQLRPTFTWTVLDVVKVARVTGYSHPDYLRGIPRVSCSYCPYKALYEYSATRPTGWEGLLEEILKREYRIWYRDKGVSWEGFRRLMLWRFPPRAARAWESVAQWLEKLAERGEVDVVAAQEVLRMNASMWVEPLPNAPIVSLEDLLRKLASYSVEENSR